MQLQGRNVSIFGVHEHLNGWSVIEAAVDGLRYSWWEFRRHYEHMPLPEGYAYLGSRAIDLADSGVRPN